MRKIKRDIYFLRKKLLDFNVKNYYSYLNNDKVLLKYYDLENNWGDKVNPYIFEKITGVTCTSLYLDELLTKNINIFIKYYIFF